MVHHSPKPQQADNSASVKQNLPSMESSSNKRARCLPDGALLDTSSDTSEPESLQIKLLQVEGSHHGLMLLIKACESDVEKLE
jgi:hypothetical protein